MKSVEKNAYIDAKMKSYNKVNNEKVIMIENLKQLLQLIRETPAIVVDFWATWVPVCKTFRPRFEQACLENKNESLIFCSVDVDMSDEVAAHFSLQSIP